MAVIQALLKNSIYVVPINISRSSSAKISPGAWV